MSVDLTKDTVAPGMTLIRTRPCMGCGIATLIEMPRDGLIAYNKGALISEAFPELSASKRELFKTGIHDDCWNQMFGSTSNNTDPRWDEGE